MKPVLLAGLILCILSSCNNNGDAAKTFCDTACRNDSFVFRGDDRLKQMAFISVKGCEADTIGWTHVGKPEIAKISVRSMLNKPIRLHRDAINAVIKDTSAAWISFNDCLTGRGYLVKITLANDGGASVISGALNSFVPKFSVDPELRAYTDRGNLYVESVNTGEMAQMTFKKEYKHIDFENISKSVDTLHVTKERMYIVLIDEEGKKVPFEKKINL